MNKINPISVNSVYADFAKQSPNQSLSQNNQVSSASVPVVQNQTPDLIGQEKPSVSDTIVKYSGLAALVAVPVAAIFAQKISADAFLKAHNKATVNTDDMLNIVTQNAQIIEQNAKIHERLSSLTDRVTGELQGAVSKNDNAIWRLLATLTGGAASGALVSRIASGESPTEEQKNNLTNETANTMNNLRRDVAIASQINGSALNRKALKNIYGFDLVSQVDFKTTNKAKYNAALKEVRAAAQKYLNGTPMKPLEPNSTVWSVTAEFAPIKEGGLGSVPPEIQSNFSKLGIKCPTILPMYDVRGKSAVGLSPADNYQSGTYTFGDTTFDIERAVTFKTSKTRGDGKIKDWQRVEVYVSTSKTVNGKKQEIAPLVFIRTNDYFKSLPYTRSGNMEETERFAFFSKAVYELEKGVFDRTSVDEFSVTNQEAFDKIGKPDAMLLNDWHAGALAALSRYKAPCEHASNIMSDEAKEKITDMNMLIICHNAQHQGSTIMNNDDVQRKEVSENILNTLFDDYTADIVENADSGSEYDGISNVLVLDKDQPYSRNVNLLNMGICLSNIDAPVSKNYARELEEDIERSTTLQWAIQQKADSKSNTHIGIINGNDYKNINQRNLAPKMTPKTGIEFATYGREMSIDDILKARAKNKIDFYNNFIRGIANGTIDPKYSKGVENVGNTTPPKLTDEELLNTPVLVSSGRLVTQKGIDVLCDSLKEVFKNWDKNHKGQPKPIVYISGQDGEEGKQRVFVEKLKKELGKDSDRIVFYHGFAPSPAYMMCGDFFLMPSIFEPCGLTQSESFAQGTPVIATAVGGLVDTIKADKPEDEYGILTEEPRATVEGFTDAIERGLDIFFDDKAKYSSMVRNAIDFDQSWVQPGKKGAIYEYADALGFNVDELPEVAA